MRILIVQRSLAPPGGGNGVAAWMIQALAGTHDVATLTSGNWSVAATNAFYGTSIREDQIIKLHARAPWSWLAGLPDHLLTRLRMCSVLRDARALTAQHDLLITADNFAAFARPGIQYVHFPARFEPPPARMPPIVTAYFRLCDRVLGAPWADAATNLTLANSQWTAEGLERLGEVSRPVVLYPPVVDPGVGLSWIDRDETFLCIGRFHESKRIETAMSIVAGVRAASMPHARLIVVGSTVDRTYTTRLRASAARYGDWIEFRDDLSRVELNRLMGRSRYGIQAMAGEHFGMAAAEMTRAGCLVFAHNSGGSPEVLNRHGALLWTTEEEAVRKIAGMAASTANGLPPHLHSMRTYAERFSTDHFSARLSDLVAGFTSAAEN